jgi:hypothetical protein
MKTHLIVVTCAAAAVAQGAAVKSIDQLPRAELHARLSSDTKVVLVQRAGLQSVAAYLDTRDDLFPRTRPAESRLLSREERETVWMTWQRFVDHLAALDSAERYHARFLRLKREAREDSFLIGYAAFLAQYRAALDFIDRTSNNPDLDRILNDPVPELGLPGDTFAKFKFRFLNAGLATGFAAREVMMKTFPGDRQPELRAAIQADAAMIWQAGKGRGELLTARNALKVIQNAADTVWLPAQAGVAEWMGDTKVYRVERSLVTPEQVRQLQPRLQPGDVLLERREWYLSNIGLPGFWPHAALYIGTAAERRAFFADEETRAWVLREGEASGALEDLLSARYPAVHAKSQRAQGKGRLPRVIEAMSEGVVLTTLEHSADCDSLAVLRPRLPKPEKARALLRAFHYTGRPYDFNFDFATDSELVCTELVYKAYEPAAGFRGLQFPLVEMLGRKVTPANELVKQFDARFATAEQQFDLVVFLDGQERRKAAVDASLDEFRKSWRRPKWHVMVQKP